MFNCSHCNKKLDTDTNFCPRCGFKQEQLQKCPICFDDKKCITLLCGHNICEICINTSYKNKKSCPICREDIEKCPECYQFRVVKMPTGNKKCLDCKSKILNVKTIINSKKIICVECKGERVLFDPSTSRYNCSDCFGYFISNTSHVVTIPKTKICISCFSNSIAYFDHPLVDNGFDRYVVKNKCNNCELENVEIKTISLEEYSKLTIKNKKDVNPDKLCPHCDSKDIYNLDNTVNTTYNCRDCNNKFYSPKIVN
tara:strand:- start:386 stop:1150 length:765 start_codon:yes stop_codon:yes gene_type:complete